MRKCPYCQHEFAPAAAPPAACPACGRTFTVPDAGGATLEFDLPTEPAPQPPAPQPKTVADLGATMEFDLPAAPEQPKTVDDVGARTLDFDIQEGPTPSSKTQPDIGATIQAGRFEPSAAEVEEALRDDANAQHTVDLPARVSQITPPNLKDLTIIWGTIDSVSGSAVIPPDSIGGISHGSVGKSGASPPASSSGRGGSSQAPGSKPGGSRGSGGGSGGGSAGSRSLEHSLVIQPRVLREEKDIDPGEEPLERIDFSLLKKLGEGGMGIVYAARQQSIRRTVALKMLKAAGAQNPTSREKFLSEAVITGELEHPNIVPIYDLGRDGSGAIFYAMKHVKGTPWDQLIEKKSPPENIEILLKVADGVAFAHSRGVIHRDLKPENVMLGDFGEVLVMDWGLALSIVDPPPHFSMGGTPAYMAPEMAIGPAHKIGIGSDVYLLGAILFEIITGQRPHIGSTTTRCLMSAAKNEIIATQKTGELMDIARKAMATQPEDRYLSIPAFQDAIREYQSHTESIALGARAQEDLAEARQSEHYDAYARALFGFQEAAELWSGNTRAKSGAFEAAAAYAECAYRKGDYDLGLSLIDASDVRNENLVARLNEARAERESRKRRLRTARRVGIGLVATIFLIVSGAFFWIRAEATRARNAEALAKEERAEALKQKKAADEQRVAAVQARQEEETQRKLAQEQERLANLAREKEEYEAYVARLGLAAAKINENSFEQAAALLTECSPKLRHWEWGRLAYLCGRDVKSFDCGHPLEAAAVSPDGAKIAVGGWGGDVQIRDAKSGDKLQTLATGGDYVFALAFSPDGERLAVGGNAKANYIREWKLTDGQPLPPLAGHTDAVLSVAYSKDGKQLLTGSYDNTARLWDLAAGTSQVFRGHDWWIWSAQFSPDEKRIVTASQDGSAIVWDAAKAVPGPPFLGHRGPVFSAVFAPDGKTIASASNDKRVLLWRPDDLREVDLEKALSGKGDPAPPPITADLDGHTAGVRSVRFSTDGRLLISSGNDNVICVWDPHEKQLLKKLRGHAGRVMSAVFAPGDQRVVSVGHDHLAKVWSVPDYEEVRVLGGRVLRGHRDSILGAAFSPDGATVVTSGRDRSAIAWDVASGKSLQTYNEGHAYLASTALFFPDGKHVLTAAVDNTARIWDVAAGTQTTVLDGTGPNAAAALASDGSWIVTGSDDRRLKIWAADGTLRKRFDELKSDVTAVAVSPDDQLILAGDAIGRCLLFTADGEYRWDARSHSRAITAAAFRPGTNRIVTASLDNTVAQRDAKTGAEIEGSLLKHPDAVTALAISNDGKQALTACADNIVRLWDLETSKLVAEVAKSDVAVTDVAFAPNGRRALTTGADNRLRLWDLEQRREILPAGEGSQAFLDLNATSLLVWAATFSADGARLLTVGGAEARLWDAADGKQLVAFTPQSAVSSVQFSRDGKQLLTGSWDNAARIWNAAGGAALMKLGGVHSRFVNASAFSPDGERVLTASDDQTARLWNAKTGEPLVKFVGHTGRVTDVAFSSDGKLALTASDDKTARIWDVATGETLHVLRGHTQGVLCAKFSADDGWVLTGADDTTARLWDARTGEALGELTGHTAGVSAVCFTPDGKRAFTGSKDITTKVWDPSTRKEILTLTGHTQEITTVAVSPDGSRVLTGSRDGTAIVWLSLPWRNEPVPPAVTAIGRAGRR